MARFNFGIDFTGGSLMEVEFKDLRAPQPIEMNEPIPGAGQGVGNPRQGAGGRYQCKCPKCGYIIKHERNLPCTQEKCPKCGASMIGA